MTQPAISRIEQGFSTHAPTVDTLLRYVHGCDRKLLIGAGTSTAGAQTVRVPATQEQELAAFLDLRTEL
jgi:transcriptional regulator with XRE-family HTH domain